MIKLGSVTKFGLLTVTTKTWYANGMLTRNQNFFFPILFVYPLSNETVSIHEAIAIMGKAYVPSAKRNAVLVLGTKYPNTKVIYGLGDTDSPSSAVCVLCVTTSNGKVVKTTNIITMKTDAYVKIESERWSLNHCTKITDNNPSMKTDKK